MKSHTTLIANANFMERIPENPEAEKQSISKSLEKEPERYFEKKEINGVELQMGWSDLEHEYTLLFLNLRREDGSMTPEAEKAGIYTPDVRTATQDPEIARKIFDHAVSLAYNEKVPIKVYKQVDHYVGQLLEGGESPEATK